MEKKTIELWDEEAGDVVPVDLPARYEVCPNCEGRGTQCKLGAMTGSEWAEACHDDPDFSDNYRSGMYDDVCHECSGLRVVLEVDEDLLDQKTKVRLHEHYENLAEQAAEERYRQRYQF